MRVAEVISALSLIPRAVWELRRARRKVARLPINLIIAELTAGEVAKIGAPTKVAVGRIGHSVRIAARMVPWRSDCLVQAMAAKEMLARAGLRSEFYIGVSRGEGDGISSHAWLKCNGEIVVGGDVVGFTLMIAPNETYQ